MALLTHQPEAPPAVRRRQRVSEFDVMRGVAIIFVVYLHAWFSPWEVTPERQKLAVHVIHLFGHSAVPVFFFISAFLLSRDNSPTFRSFASRKLRRIVVPTIVWVAAAFLYRLWQDGWSRQLGIDLALFNVSGQFYYLVVLAFFMATFYFARFLPERILPWLAAAAFMANLGVIGFYEQRTISGEFATLAYRNPGVWVFAYALGYWIGRSSGTLAWTRRYLVPTLLTMGALMTIYLIRGEQFDDYPVSYFGSTVFLFGACGLIAYPALASILLAKTASGWLLRPFQDLSRYAFAIYLVHMPFFMGWLSNKLLAESALREDYWALMNTEFIVGFSASLIFVVVVSRLLPGLSETFLGIERRNAA